jgi:N-acetylneuraminic acid mutarotase
MNSIYAAFRSIIIILFGTGLVGSALAQGSWTTKADLPTARAALSASVVNGKIYVMGGGVTGTDWGDPLSPEMEMYDPATDTWDTTKANMPWGRGSLTSVTVNSKIYALGGQSLGGITAESSVIIYDPQTDSWDTTTTVMPGPRSGLCAEVVNGKIYVIGGWNFSYPAGIAAVWEYDPVSNTWDTTKAVFPTPRSYLATCVVDNKIYAFGGVDNDVTYDGVSTLEVYDPATNQWSQKADMPAPRIYLEADAVDGLIYIFGGSDNPDHLPSSNVWEYSPAYDAYREVASMPAGLLHAASGEVGGKIYIFGGAETAITLPLVASSKVFEFTPPIINVPADQPTIQAAIDSSSEGDMVLVADSTYYENINFKGKKITVASHYVMDGDTNHISNTIINGSQPSNPDSGSVVYFVSGEDTNSVLTGFTITGGTGTGSVLFPGWLPTRAGGGILILSSGAKIEKNKIINNNITAAGDTVVGGTGINAFGNAGDYIIVRDNLISENTATAVTYAIGTINWGTVEACLFERNQVTGNVCDADAAFGGGLYVQGQMGWQGAHIIRNNIIKNNILLASSYSGGGGIYIENCSPVVANNIISGNGFGPAGGGIWIFHWTAVDGVPRPVLINNTIINNTAASLGGGLRVGGSPQACVKIMNTVFWGNSSPNGTQISVGNGSITDSVEVRYSDVQGGWTGGGNIDADPLLVADSLSDASPSIGAGILQYDFGGGVVLHSPATDINGRIRPYPAGYSPDMGAWESKFGPVGIEAQPSAGIVKSFALEQNYPNPFNPTTAIEFSIPKSAFVSLKIYNILGEEVATLVSEKLVTGRYKYNWDASALASGVYFYRIQAGNYVEAKKMILLR